MNLMFPGKFQVMQQLENIWFNDSFLF